MYESIRNIYMFIYIYITILPDSTSSFFKKSNEKQSKKKIEHSKICFRGSAQKLEPTSPRIPLEKFGFALSEIKQSLQDYSSQSLNPENIRQIFPEKDSVFRAMNTQENIPFSHSSSPRTLSLSNLFFFFSFSVTE
ncbi:hypothetical protein TorRG33x02_174300 [Trema orientale]|uniref:Uncharacterized protein n=1 Tax=Trema orientale TaxID=63057 RepID=A0A2P5EMI4_TREOI|nr:hypothetical protein TorRG33x02_174300 [Trema orientale]